MPKAKGRSRQRFTRPAPSSTRAPGRRLSQATLALARQELVSFHQLFAQHFQRLEQRCWSALYLCGQLADLERKTIEPMVLALVGVAPEIIRAVQQFIGQSPWKLAPLIHQQEALVAAWLGQPDGVVIVDGSGFPKRGDHSAGVGWQYCGRVGKVDNCQEGVFAVYASARGQAFLAGQLYLPQDWFDRAHAQRWQACGIPPATQFRTEPEIALELLGQLIEDGQVPFRWVAADEEFGRIPAFLDGVAQLGKWYLVEVPKNTRVWLRTPRVEPPGPGLLGRPRLHPRVVRSAPAPQPVEELAANLPARQWRRGLIQEGGKGPLWAEFAWLRVTRVCDQLPGPRNWLMLRRSLSPKRELKYYLSNAPASYPHAELMRLAGWRWPIETAFEEGKGEVGLDHYETRSWLGWHHHMQQSFMAHLFLVRLQQLLQKKSRAHCEPGPAHYGPSRQQRNRRPSGPSRLHSVSAEAQPPGLSLSPQANATSFAI